MTAPLTPEALDELESMLAAEDGSEFVVTVGDEHCCAWREWCDLNDKMRSALPTLLAAARERDALAAENARLKARVAELEKVRDGIGTDRLLWRGVDGDPCDRCNGAGVFSYGNTATWRGGAGGNMVTLDVCNACWGSGDQERKGCDLRRLRAELDEAQRRRGIENEAFAEAEDQRRDLEHALEEILALAHEPVRAQDPWEVVARIGEMAEAALGRRTLSMSRAHGAIQKLVQMAVLYRGYLVKSRGPLGLIIDAIEILDPETGGRIKRFSDWEDWNRLLDREEETGEAVVNRPAQHIADATTRSKQAVMMKGASCMSRCDCGSCRTIRSALAQTIIGRNGEHHAACPRCGAPMRGAASDGIRRYTGATMSTASTYRPCGHCGCDCDNLDWQDNEPCWGEVTVVDEDTWEDESGHPDSAWVHACKGHVNNRNSCEYVPEPAP